MLIVAMQSIPLVLLIIGMVLGKRRWINPHIHNAKPEQVGFIMLVILTFLGGLIGSPFWWLDVQISFSWDLPPLAARMLGAAGFSFALAAYLALERPTTQRLRQISYMLFVYLTPLAIAIFLFHLDRFDFKAPITYAFFALVAGMIIANLFFLMNRTPGLIASELVSISPIEKAWLITVAIITGLWGLALFITDNGASDFIWVWRGDLLTSRLIGSMLMTISAGSLTPILQGEVTRQIRLTTLVYGIGLALAAIWNSFAGLPVKWSYVIVFGVIGIVSGLIELLPKIKTKPAKLNS